MCQLRLRRRSRHDELHLPCRVVTGRGAYIGSCLEFPSRYFRALTPHEAIVGVQRMIDEELVELAEFGCTAPASLIDRHYSGRFVVRTSAALHARLMVEAAEQRVSFNHWVVQKLADRPVGNTLDDLF